MSCVHKFTVYIKWNSADLVVEATAKNVYASLIAKFQQKVLNLMKARIKTFFRYKYYKQKFFYIH